VSRVLEPGSHAIVRFLFRLPVVQNAVQWPNPAYLANFSQRTWLGAASSSDREGGVWLLANLRRRTSDRDPYLFVHIGDIQPTEATTPPGLLVCLVCCLYRIPRLRSGRSILWWRTRS
jgi:hypothetical protein